MKLIKEALTRSADCPSLLHLAPSQLLGTQIVLIKPFFIVPFH